MLALRVEISKQDLHYCDYISTVYCRTRKGTTVTFSFSYNFLFFLEFLVVAFSLYSLVYHRLGFHQRLHPVNHAIQFSLFQKSTTQTLPLLASVQLTF